MGTETATAPATIQNPPASRRRFTPVHGLVVSLALTLAASFLPTALSVRGHRALVISVLTVAMWVCEVLPIEMTSVLFSVLIVVFKVLPPAKAFGGYSDPTPWFIMSVLLFGLAVTGSGLGKRISLNMARLFGTSFKGMTAALIPTGLVLCFLTPAGVERILIIYPIAMGSAIAIMGRSMPESNVSKFFMSVAYIAGNAFGYGILTGNAANLLAIGVVKQVTGKTILWAQWAMWFFVPVAITSLISIYILYKMYPPERTDMPGGYVKVREELAEMGRITPRELKTSIYLLLALLIWVTDFWHGIPAWAVGVFIATLMTAPIIGCLESKELKKLPFNIVVFSAAVITIGIVMQETGIGTWLGQVTLGRLISPKMSLSVASAITFLVSSVLHFLLVETKTAVAGLLPVVANYFQMAGMPALAPTMLCLMACLTSTFLPFMVLPGLLMVGLGPHFSYKHATVTLSVFSGVSIVVQLVSCFTWYRWVGLI